MEGWLPPRAPGGKPPPRFDVPVPAAEEEDSDSMAEPSGPSEPAGWQPPVARPPDQAIPAFGPPAEAAPPDVGRPAERPPLRPAAASPANPAAVWALVFGIAGLLVLLLSFGFGFALALPCSAAAWALARRAAARIERGESSRGASQAQAALWLGRIGVVTGVAAMTAFIVLSILGYDFDALRENLQGELERRRDSAR